MKETLQGTALVVVRAGILIGFNQLFYTTSQSGGLSGASDSWLETIRNRAKQALNVASRRVDRYGGDGIGA